MVIHNGIHLQTNGRRTYDITADVRKVVQGSGLQSGICNLFIQHTSASLFLSENADPTVQSDLIHYLQKLVPDDDPDYVHTYEGPDDLPAHIKSAILPTSLSSPFMTGRLLLGTWQAIYLWEHRIHSHYRHVIVTLMGE